MIRYFAYLTKPAWHVVLDSPFFVAGDQHCKTRTVVEAPPNPSVTVVRARNIRHLEIGSRRKGGGDPVLGGKIPHLTSRLPSEAKGRRRLDFDSF